MADTNTRIRTYLQKIYRDTNTDLETLVARWMGQAPTKRTELQLSQIAEYSPHDITGLAYWLNVDGLQLFTDTTATTKVSADAQSVKCWTDSLNGWKATEATNPPVYKVNILNGYPSVRFDGTNDILSLETAGLGMLKNVSGATGFIVHNSTFSGTTTQDPFAITVNGTSGNKFTLEHNTTSNGSVGGRFRALDADAGFVSTSAGSKRVSGTAAVQTLWMDYTNASTQSWVNGTSAVGPTSTAAGTTAGNTSNTNSDVIRIGANGVGSGQNFLNGDLFEILVFNVALSTANRVLVERYLGLKYGITVS